MGDLYRGLACALCLLCGASLADAQPASRAGNGLVHVPVVVRDANGHPVRDLRPADFDVFENGRRRALVDVAIFQRAPEDREYVPRRVVLVLDDLNVRPQHMPLATRAVRELLQRLDARDLVALVNTSTLPDVEVDFTTARVALGQALDRIRGQRQPDLAFTWQRARQGLAVLERVLAQLRSARGSDERLTLVLVSEGYDFEPAAQRGQVDVDILRDVRTVVGLAAQANVAIYAIDPSGLDINGQVFRSTGTRPIGPAASMRFGMSSSLSAIDDLSALAALAHDTGGRLTRVTNDLLTEASAMLADADDYYVLTYEMPEATDADRRGSVPTARQIDVRVRRPHLTVRAPQSYLHPAVIAAR